MKISILWWVPWGSNFTAYKARRFRFRMSGIQSTFRIFGLNRGVGPFHTSHAPYCLTSKYSRSVTERLSLFASRTGPVVGTVVARHEEGNSVVQGERRKASADTDEREVREREEGASEDFSEVESTKRTSSQSCCQMTSFLAAFASFLFQLQV